jgi:amino acid adenylation domain-containing protein
MLTESERQRIVEWNSTDRSYPRDRAIPELVRARAIESPDAPAIVAGDRTLTYAQLDTRANRIAHELVALGAGPEVVVGLHAGRSPEMIVGALAILKAGAAYLPLDTSYPRERLSFLVEDARCPILLCGPGRLEGVAAQVDHALSIHIAGPSASTPPETRIEAGHLAYVIYTSGSTGRPKGVEITHAGLLNLVFWHQRTFGVSPADRATQIASVGFDAAVWELWPTLAAGASVHLPEDTVRSDPEALRDWLLAQRISITFVPTPMAERLLALRWPVQASLRLLLTGGDTLHRHPSPELPFLLVNNYGPTESTVVATSGPLSPYQQPDRRPTIGRPIDNTKIHILDEQLHEVAIGAPGELHIGGAGLARGYLNQPELTAARFVPDPFDALPGGRLYKTGDLARRLPDGQIAFVGRVDDQLKIRGFRIEPNEIVTALDQHPEVTASAVIASALGAGDKRLVAYVVPAVGSRPTPGGLQASLRLQLPDYMVPAIFVRLDALPIGPNGKLDRSALPEPDPANTLRDAAFEEPRTGVEKRVAALVQELLGLERVSRDDNFFLLGGHSLMGTQLIGRIRGIFAVELSLRTIFDAPTVARLSGQIERLLLEKLATISDEEAARLLSARQGAGGEA